MPEKDISTWQYLWGVLSIPLAWLWTRQNSQRDDVKEIKENLSAHEIDNAKNTFNKSEVAAIVDRSTKPIVASVERIEKSVDKLINYHMKNKD